EYWLPHRRGTCRYVQVTAEATDHQNCVRTVSHTPRNPGVTPLFTGTQRGTLMLTEVVDGNCVDAIWCVSARASGTNFQACSFSLQIGPHRRGTCRYVQVIAEATDHQNCVRTVSHTPRNPGVTPLFTGTQRGTLMLREVVDGNCVDAIWCVSARASGTNFQACSFSLRPRQHFRDIHGERYGRGPTQERHSAPNTTVHKPAVQSRSVLAECNLQKQMVGTSPQKQR